MMIVIRFVFGFLLIIIGLYLFINSLKTSYKEYGKGGDSLGKTLNSQGIWGGLMAFSHFTLYPIPYTLYPAPYSKSS
ncbi:MAG: hypothetical protein KGZ97_04715 [Bacteroidetes bacterium]|nr:hypothetical protein [Bacteroidota bacterium]